MATVREIQSIEPYEFEKLVEELWESKGYETNVRSESRDKGIDIDAERGGLTEKIQVKRYAKSNKIGSEEVRKYATIYQQTNANSVVLVTSGEVTNPARELAQDLGVNLIDGKELLRQLDSSRVDISDYTNSADSPQNESEESGTNSSITPLESALKYKDSSTDSPTSTGVSTTEDEYDLGPFGFFFVVLLGYVIGFIVSIFLIPASIILLTNLTVEDIPANLWLNIFHILYFTIAGLIAVLFAYTDYSEFEGSLQLGTWLMVALIYFGVAVWELTNVII